MNRNDGQPRHHHTKPHYSALRGEIQNLSKMFRDYALHKGSAENGGGMSNQPMLLLFTLGRLLGFDGLMAVADGDSAKTGGQSIAGFLWNAGRGIYCLAQRESKFHSLSPVSGGEPAAYLAKTGGR